MVSKKITNVFFFFCFSYPSSLLAFFFFDDFDFLGGGGVPELEESTSDDFSSELKFIKYRSVKKSNLRYTICEVTVIRQSLLKWQGSSPRLSIRASQLRTSKKRRGIGDIVSDLSSLGIELKTSCT